MNIDDMKNLLDVLVSEYKWLSLVILAVIAAMILLYKHRYYYEKKEYLCSRSERKLLKKLLDLLPREYCVHCQTSLISLLIPADLRSARMVWAKRMDYVITDRDSRILLVIELDDQSHTRKDRKKRDKFVNKTLRGKHPLLRITTDNSLDINYLKSEIEKLLE